MGSFWLFRSDLRQLEYYHQYTDLNEFKLKCHDFYLLMSLFFLENDDFDEVIIWRLQPKQEVEDIIFNINGKRFIQKFVNTFKESYIYENVDISFFRGGFMSYCEITKENPKHFGLKLYLGAGRRVTPQYGGNYNKILVESERDMIEHPNCIPFYKTANSNIFFPNSSKKEYDLCLISNFEQSKFKGQEFFIREISKSEYLKGLKILHIGNKPSIGIDLSKKYKVNNISFIGTVSRQEINEFLNKSKFGVVCSDESDGCPRVITEVLMTGTPLLVRSKTRLLNFYKEKGVCVFNDSDFENKVRYSIDRYDILKQGAIENINNITINKICDANLKLWR